MDWAKLRQLIETSFNDQEVRTLCFDLRVDYESLEGIGKEAKVREFIAWTMRNDLVPELMAALKKRRPNVAWQEIEPSSEDTGGRAGMEPGQEIDEGTRSPKSATSPSSGTQFRVQAEEFFYTLDDKVADTFPDMVKDAIRVQILGRTVVNLLGNYQKIFAQLGNLGCEIHLLFVDPKSQTAEFLYGGDPELFMSNMTTAARQVKNLKQAIGYRLQVRATKHAPTVSIIIIEKQERSHSFMQVQLYFLHSAVGRDRPIFRLSYDDKWYGVFHEEFSQLWSGSSEWSASDFLEAVNKGEI